MSCGRERPFGQFGSAAPAVSPPKLLPTPSLLAGGTEGEQEKAVTLCKHGLAAAKPWVWYINAVLVTGPKRAAMKKVSSIPPRLSTHPYNSSK